MPTPRAVSFTLSVQVGNKIGSLSSDSQEWNKLTLEAVGDIVMELIMTTATASEGSK